ncbi:hypothetical protein A3K72_01770 [Candidatus Woesearchaeota archaeon RBG_13_36_6]|nr:MAG: hypothetical protein A3K72_01770 [Candidatus Woesearchaeota archaeon RBG_13_36_6]
MLDSDLGLDKARHILYHLALAANKLEAKKEIGAAISKSSKVGKKKKGKTNSKEKAEIIKKINKRLTSIEKKIKLIKKKGNYDPKKLSKVELKIEIIKRKLKQQNSTHLR